MGRLDSEERLGYNGNGGVGVRDGNKGGCCAVDKKRAASEAIETEIITRDTAQEAGKPGSPSLNMKGQPVSVTCSACLSHPTQIL